MINPKTVIHVYCMPGMAANPTIFEHIRLPEDQYQVHWLSWIPPKKNEPITGYARRICEFVKHENVILIGVSLGGVIVQEMKKYIKVRLLILISTIKTKYELPGLMRFGRKTKLYKLLPLKLAQYYDRVEKLPFGKKTKSRIKLYKNYIGVVDKPYLKWSIDQILNWKQEKAPNNFIHIHGDEDHLFPIKNIDRPIVLKGGTHIMIINRFRWFNDHLPQLIQENIAPEKP